MPLVEVPGSLLNSCILLIFIVFWVFFERLCQAAKYEAGPDSFRLSVEKDGAQADAVGDYRCLLWYSLYTKLRRKLKGQILKKKNLAGTHSTRNRVEN